MVETILVMCGLLLAIELVKLAGLIMSLKEEKKEDEEEIEML